MGQKIHPLGLRLGITQKPRSYWYAPTEQYAYLAVEDQHIRTLLQKNYKEAGIAQITIQRKLNQIYVEIYAARPAVFVGKDPKGIDSLRVKLEQKCINFRTDLIKHFGDSFFNEERGTILFKNPKIVLQITERLNPEDDASFLGDFVVEQLEKRVAFRRAIRQAMQRAERAKVKGIKIQVSGRLNGAEIARTEWIREGRVPLQTLRADIDYSYKTAQTIYGILGVKVWVFKNDNSI
uniref:Small ribosomal subunit protein uS3c n=1 Tax=Pedinomonas tuberculata TaxID=160064 RepID=A0A097KL95_9CHLO|nr:ribosomal protein S3 [Pedinomonas tuberculata]AIT93938.1 ribosomal protein S3 [Pedinomonas tuberculata]